MNNKITFPKLAALLADKSGRSKRFSEDFIREFFALISETLEEGDTIKIKGFGSFRLSRVEPRMSVDVTTGQPIEIAGHTKVVFAPSKELGETINAPFEAFSPIAIDEDFDVSRIEGDFKEENTVISEQNIVSDEVIDNSIPSGIESISTKDSIGFVEETKHITTPKESAGETDDPQNSEEVIDFSSNIDDITDPTIDRHSTAAVYNSEESIQDQDSPTSLEQTNNHSGDIRAEVADSTDESVDTLEYESPTTVAADDSEEMEENLNLEDAPVPSDIQEEEAPVSMTDEEESVEYKDQQEEISSETESNDDINGHVVTDISEDIDSEIVDGHEATSDNGSFEIIPHSSDCNDDGDVTEVHDIEELQPEEYEEEMEEVNLHRNRRKQWIKGFIVGIAAAIGAVLITFIIWYFYTKPSFTQDDKAREVPNLFAKQEPVSSEVIPTQAIEPENDSENIVDATEEATDSEIAKQVATAASDVVILDTISTTRYLITMAKEHYGNMNLWPYIYEENKKKLGDPDRIRPGTPIVIPPLSKYGIDPRNPKDIDKAKRLGIEIYARFGK